MITKHVMNCIGGNAFTIYAKGREFDTHSVHWYCNWNVVVFSFFFLFLNTYTFTLQYVELSTNARLWLIYRFFRDFTASRRAIFQPTFDAISVDCNFSRFHRVSTRFSSISPRLDAIFNDRLLDFRIFPRFDAILPIFRISPLLDAIAISRFFRVSTRYSTNEISRFFRVSTRYSTNEISRFFRVSNGRFNKWDFEIFPRLDAIFNDCTRRSLSLSHNRHSPDGRSALYRKYCHNNSKCRIRFV